MNKKAFFFDIDETLLSWITGEVPESALYALKELKKMGHITFINTGRVFTTVPEIVKVLPVTGFVCGCGTQILKEGETLMFEEITQERLTQIINVIRGYGGDLILEGKNDVYFPENKTRFDKLEWARDLFGNLGFGRNIFIEDKERECPKYCFYVDEQSDIDKILAELSKDMNIMDRGDFYEVSPIPYTKASGIDFVLDYFGVDKENAYVFGDSSNDLSMFQAVKHAIAMEKHDPVLDPYTEFVTKTVEEDGVLYALQHYGIL